MRSPVFPNPKLIFDGDLISQPVYVLDADDEGTGDMSFITFFWKISSNFFCNRYIVVYTSAVELCSE